MLTPMGVEKAELGSLWCCEDCGALVPQSYLHRHNNDHAMQASLQDSLKTLWERVPGIDGFHQKVQHATDFAPVTLKDDD